MFEVVKHMKGDKSPGPDGFSMGFIKACWGGDKRGLYGCVS